MAIVFDTDQKFKGSSPCGDVFVDFGFARHIAASQLTSFLK